jgi:hypothetical protein
MFSETSVEGGKSELNAAINGTHLDIHSCTDVCQGVRNP